MDAEIESDNPIKKFYYSYYMEGLKTPLELEVERKNNKMIEAFNI